MCNPWKVKMAEERREMRARARREAREYIQSCMVRPWTASRNSKVPGGPRILETISQVEVLNQQ